MSPNPYCNLSWSHIHVVVKGMKWGESSVPFIDFTLTLLKTLWCQDPSQLLISHRSALNTSALPWQLNISEYCRTKKFIKMLIICQLSNNMLDFTNKGQVQYTNTVQCSSLREKLVCYALPAPCWRLTCDWNAPRHFKYFIMFAELGQWDCHAMTSIHKPKKKPQ